MTEREVYLETIGSYRGRFYLWGGDDPSGIDCSGLVLEGLKATGRVPRRSSAGGGEFDTTANGLLELGKARGWEIKEEAVREGCLVFYLTQTGRAIHVVTVWGNPLLALGANGGGRKIQDQRNDAGDVVATALEQAIRYNAFVKLRPWRSRAAPWAFLDPFRELEVPPSS